MAKGLAALMLMKPKGSGDEESPESGPAAPSEDEYGKELAELVGVDDVESFTKALAGFVRACMRKEDEGEYDEEA